MLKLSATPQKTKQILLQKLLDRTLGKESVLVTSTLHPTPEHILLILTPYEIVTSLSSFQVKKITTPVILDQPIVLSLVHVNKALSEVTHTDDEDVAQSINKGNVHKVQYFVRAFASHSGATGESGHWTMTLKHIQDKTKPSSVGWYIHNDAIVTHKSFTEMPSAHENVVVVLLETPLDATATTTTTTTTTTTSSTTPCVQGKFDAKQCNVHSEYPCYDVVKDQCVDLEGDVYVASLSKHEAVQKSAIVWDAESLGMKRIQNWNAFDINAKKLFNKTRSDLMTFREFLLVHLKI
jgi:hypothetical protein